MNPDTQGDLEHGITSKSTTVEKLFDFGFAQCGYTNTNTIKIESND